jgi:hypothetical protein
LCFLKVRMKWLLSANCQWAARSETLNRPEGRGEGEPGFFQPTVTDIGSHRFSGRGERPLQGPY